MTLVCIGLTTLDIGVWPVDAHPQGDGVQLVREMALQPAGTAAGMALVAAKLGLAVSLVGAVGDDEAGRLIASALARASVDVTHLATIADRPTSTTLLLVSSEDVRPKYVVRGAGWFPPLTAEAAEAASAAKFLHWAGIGAPTLDGGPGEALLMQAKVRGATVSCDLIAPRPTAAAEAARLMPHIDYFLPSATEAYALSGADNPAAAADVFLAQGAGAVLIKLGAQGVYVAAGGERTLVPAHPIQPKDTTSCGDSFCAGFICALDRGQDPRDAAAFGVAVAAQVAQGLGTLGALIGVEQVQATLNPPAASLAS